MRFFIFILFFYSILTVSTYASKESLDRFAIKVNLGSQFGETTKFKYLDSNVQYKDSSLNNPNFKGVNAGLGIGYVFNNNYILFLDYAIYSITKGTTYNGQKNVLITANNILYVNNLITSTIMLNLQYTFLNKELIKPYLHIGIGITLNNAKTTLRGKSTWDTNLGTAYKLGLGFNYKINDTFSFFSEYAFANLGKVVLYKDYFLPDSDKSVFSITRMQHEVNLGILYNFSL